MERHRKRDKESGGKGTLNTRKRSWRDGNGAIVQKRSATQQPLVESTGEPEHDNRLSTAKTVTEGPTSPSLSLQSYEVPSSLHGQEPYQHLAFGLPKDASLAFAGLSFDSTNFQLADTFGDDFYESSFQPVYYGAHTSITMPYDEVFRSDTASSFNMPYTTATNYNWLFDINTNMGINDKELGDQGLHRHQQQSHPQLQQHRQMISLDTITPGTYLIPQNRQAKVPTAPGRQASTLLVPTPSHTPRKLPVKSNRQLGLPQGDLSHASELMQPSSHQRSILPPSPSNQSDL